MIERLYNHTMTNVTKMENLFSALLSTYCNALYNFLYINLYSNKYCPRETETINLI